MSSCHDSNLTVPKSPVQLSIGVQALRSISKTSPSKPSTLRPHPLVCGSAWPVQRSTGRRSPRNGAPHYEFTGAQASRNGDDSLNFKTVDDHHHDSLRALIARHDIEHLWTEEEILAISRVWHFLDGWSDSTRGLQILKDRGSMVCTLSDGNLR